MPDSDILKEKTLSNGQVIGLVFFLVGATFTVTKILDNIDKNAERIEYVNERVDRKFKQIKE